MSSWTLKGEERRERERVDGDGSGHFSPSPPSPSFPGPALFLSPMDGTMEGGRRNE